LPAAVTKKSRGTNRIRNPQVLPDPSSTTAAGQQVFSQSQRASASSSSAGRSAIFRSTLTFSLGRISGL